MVLKACTQCTAGNRPKKLLSRPDVRALVDLLQDGVLRGELTELQEYCVRYVKHLAFKESREALVREEARFSILMLALEQLILKLGGNSIKEVMEKYEHLFEDKPQTPPENIKDILMREVAAGPIMVEIPDHIKPSGPKPLRSRLAKKLKKENQRT